MPEFMLQSLEFNKAYRDRIIPLAIDPIRQREDPNRKLLNSVEMSKTPIPVSKEGDDEGVWGVATWSDIDMRIDFFSIYVKGLSSAYRWTDPPKVAKGAEPAAGRKFQYKTLELNFWRAGDEYFPTQHEIYYGIPGKVDYEWVYR